MRRSINRLSLFSFISLLLSSFISEINCFIVEIKNGTLQGSIMKSRSGREFLSFRGIPYALPPLGDLRFEPPKPSLAWDGIRFAKDDAPICTQRNIYTHDDRIVGQEDCLYLNVYTPIIFNTSSNYPVMIWFHGGGWVTGAGHSLFYNPKFLLDHDVVLVTVNFRLGPLGFLSTEDMVIPGNQGMKDQSQAIRWVNENIETFNGDPNRLTIFGESAGGASVHYHLISPLSRDFIHRGISQSGSVLNPWVLNRPGIAKRKAKMLGELLKCPTANSNDLLHCLKRKDAVEIIGTDRSFQIFDYDPMIPFRPVIEPNHSGAFLIKDPLLSVSNGEMADVPWMAGFNSHEGTLKVAGLYGIKENDYVQQLDENFIELAPITLMYGDKYPENFHKEIGRRIRQFYLGMKSIDKSTKCEVIDMYSDAWFNVGIDMSIRKHLRTLSSPVYYYYFAYKGSASFSRIFGDEEEEYGVSHADELQYLFPVGEQLFPDVLLTEEDYRMVDVITQLWFNFAKTGNPTPFISSDIQWKWKPVRTEALEYLHINNSRQIQMSKYLLKERMEFWSTLPYDASEIIGHPSLVGKDEL